MGEETRKARPVFAFHRGLHKNHAGSAYLP